MAVKEPHGTSDSSLSRATQASFLQHVHGDKRNSLSAKNLSAGRSAPHRLSFWLQWLLPSSGLHLPRALKHSSSRKNGKSRGPREDAPYFCSRLLSP